MCKTKRLGTFYFELLGCFVDSPSQQLLVVTDSASTTRNLHDNDQGWHRTDGLSSLSL